MLRNVRQASQRIPRPPAGAAHGDKTVPSPFFPNFVTPRRSYASIKYAKGNSTGNNYRFLKIGAIFGLGGTIVYFSNDTVSRNIKHFVLTSERVGVVVVATARCFNLYKKTLGTEYGSDKERREALAATHKKAAKITLKALETNGGIYIKLGQHISALTYLLPREWTETMIPLQDKCPQSSLEEIEGLFKQDLGVDMHDFFSEFDAQPVGVASLAQVHIARLRKTGEKVAVKVQHPSLIEFVPLDVYLIQKVFGAMYRVFPEYPLTWLGDEVQKSIFVELDFTNEAVNAERTAQYFEKFQKETALVVPGIVESHRRILIMSYLAGARLDNLEYMKQNKISTADVSSCLSHIFNNMIFTPHVGLHCDPHPGNLAIRKLDKPRNGHNFEIILYDHGLYRQIPVQIKRDYSHFWLALLDNDIPNMRKYTERITGIQDEQKFKIFISAITGRDPDTAMNYDISKARSEKEIKSMQHQLQEEEGVLEGLMELLNTMPRVILLILKTNDLTRNLDENLNNPLGPERTFLILANYCANAVYEESKEKIRNLFTKFSLRWAYESIKCWLAYEKRVSSLYLYDLFMVFKNLKVKLNI